MLKTKSGIFLFNIIPSYRPGMSKVFDHGFYDLACTPSLAQRTKQNTLYTSFEDLVGESLSDLDLLYIMATDGTNTFAKINWVDPGAFDCVEQVSAITFTENEGFTGNALSNYLTTGWTPSIDAVNFQQNDGGVLCYINNDIAGDFNKFAFGALGNAANSANGRIQLAPRGGSDQHSFSVNGGSTARGSSVTSDGFYHLRRASSADHRIFKNGSQVGTTDNSASTTLSNKILVLGALNNNGTIQLFSDHQIGMFGIGASLTGQESALYTAWTTYFTSL